MAIGIIVHVAVGSEKRTEFFSDESIRIGASEKCDLQIHASDLSEDSVWLKIERDEEGYRIIDFSDGLEFGFNG